MNIQSSINQLIGSAGTFGGLARKYKADTAAAAAQQDTAEYTKKMHELNLANAEKRGAWLDAKTEQTEAQTSSIIAKTHRDNGLKPGQSVGRDLNITPLEAIAAKAISKPTKRLNTLIKQDDLIKSQILYNGSAKDPVTGKFISVKEAK